MSSNAVMLFTGILPRMTAATSAAGSARSLSALLREGASSREMADHLDGLSAAARVDEVRAIRGSAVGKLYDAVADAPAITPDEFVPPSTKGTLIYEGGNSLPAFNRFQKRFLRLESGMIIGYNHQAMGFVTGPGYFAVKPANGEGLHGKEMFFDYTVPAPESPEGWPAYKSNDSGLSKLVYGGMIDFVRRVARGVVVGKAYVNGVDRKAYFTLTLP
jgi:hypothetical protein